MILELDAPEVEPAPYTAADAAWWTLESARVADRRELADHYAEASSRDYDEDATLALQMDLYQSGWLPL